MRSKPVITTGSEWKAFLADPATFSHKEAYMDDVAYVIDGKEVDSFLVDEREIEDTAKVEVQYGELHPEGTSIFVDLLERFHDWKRSRTHIDLLVRIPRDAEGRLTALLAEIGGEVLVGATNSPASARQNEPAAG